MLKSDGWDTEPFTLTEVNGKLYGRGSTDDKGPVLCTLHAIEAYQKLGMELPVNLKASQYSSTHHHHVSNKFHEKNVFVFSLCTKEWKSRAVKDWMSFL